jgi:hypothetical protein
MLIWLNNTLQDADSVLVALARIKMFYNPDLAENEKFEDDYSKFVLSLLLAYVDQAYSTVDGKNVTVFGINSDLRKSVCLHLRELAT